jgi:hypothetical protein
VKNTAASGKAAMELFELAPDGRKSIESFRTLEQAIERAQAILPSRPDVGQFRIYATSGVGRRRCTIRPIPSRRC